MVFAWKLLDQSWRSFFEEPGVRHSPLLHHEGVPSRNTCSIIGEFVGQHMSNQILSQVFGGICRWNLWNFWTNFLLVCRIAEVLRKHLLPQCLGLLMPCEPPEVSPGPGRHWTYKLTFRWNKKKHHKLKPIVFIIIDTWWYMSICIIFVYHCDSDVLVV